MVVSILGSVVIFGATLFESTVIVTFADVKLQRLPSEAEKENVSMPIKPVVGV